MKTYHSWFDPFVRLAAVGAVLAAASATQAVVISDIAGFQAGATVERFDDLPGLPISSPSAVEATGFTFSSRDPDNTPTFDSGGATPSDPKTNPGVPVAIVAPSGTAGSPSSPSNVAAPIGIVSDPLTALEPGAFMEIAMPKDKDAIKVGFFVTHGTVLVLVQDIDFNTLATETVTAGNFVGYERPTADIRNISLTLTGGATAFMIDDFTYAFSANGTGGGGNGGSTVPDTGSALNLVLAAGLLGLARWKFRTSRC